MSIPAAIYARVSSDRQREQDTITSQTAALKVYADAHEYTVPPEWVFEDDGYSGSTLVRPGLEAVRDLVAAGQIAAVLVYAPDRLSRKYAYQILLAEEFARQGVRVVYLNAPPANTPEEHLLLQVQGMIAEYERAQLLERTRRGKRHKARCGSLNAMSAAPYGYRYVRKTEHTDAYYEVDEVQAAVVRHIFSAYCQEGLSMYAITRRLTAQQAPTRNGGTWDPATIRKLLRNPAYIGKAAYGKFAPSTRQRITRRVRLAGRLPLRDQSRRERPREEWVEIPVPPLISEETFELAQAQLAHNRRFARRHTKEPSLLQGLLVCGQCGYAIHRKRGVYRCWGRDAWRRRPKAVCTAPVTRQDHLDALIWGEVIRLLEDPTLVEAELARRREAARDADPTRQRFDDLLRQQTRVATAIDRLVTAYQQELVTLEDLRARMPALRTQQRTIAAEREAIETATTDEARYLRLSETLADFRTKLRARADALDITERQKIVRLLIREIRIDVDAITICHSLPLSSADREGSGGSTPIDPGSVAGSQGRLLHVPRQGLGLRVGEGYGACRQFDTEHVDVTDHHNARNDAGRNDPRHRRVHES
jgi:site-specific DNA recombinase